MPNNYHREGFWRSKEEPDLPIPESHNAPVDNAFIERLKKKQSRALRFTFKGYSRCRICNCRNGSLEFASGMWRWPEGYIHYIETHNVHPSSEFYNFVTRRR